MTKNNNRNGTRFNWSRKLILLQSSIKTAERRLARKEVDPFKVSVHSGLRLKPDGSFNASAREQVLYT